MPRIKIIRPPEQRERIQMELAEIRAWRAWELGRSRCPYCVDLTDDYVWLSVCDCFYDEELKEQLNTNIRRWQREAENGYDLGVLRRRQRDDG